MRANGVKNINHILHGDQTILEKNLQGRSTTPPALAKTLCDTNAEAQSVCSS